MQCTLCNSTADLYCQDRKRRYFRCCHCDLIFADPETYLSEQDERAIYDFHENDPNDARYRQFLSQLLDPLLNKLSPGMQGLDFGCGPGPTLNLMLEERGMQVGLYDLYYFPQPERLLRRYDFVTATEVVEHFRRPAESWRELSQLITTGGWLGVMTSLMTKASPAEFKNWNYKNDPTHVSFYTPRTMVWLARTLGFECDIISDRVVLFRNG